ncbi:MAG: class I SAM-dependent methyltransferase [Bacteroidota bacterium]|nr:class I SAM-dependent methyltransferase [Bacteroidota bacterium]
MRDRTLKRLYSVFVRLAPQRILVNGALYWSLYAAFWSMTRRRASGGVLGTHWKNEGTFLEILKHYARGDADALEIGCGGGRITREAAPLVRTLVATDVSRGMLALARRALRDRPNVVFARTDGFTLEKFTDASFDLVFSHDVFVHFSSLQTYPYLREIRRVLRQGGVALLSFYSFTAQFAVFRDLALEYHSARKIPLHMRIHFVTEEMLRAMATDAGLQVEKIDSGDFLTAVFRKP